MRLVVFVLGALWSVHCAHRSPSTGDRPPLRYLALGDSYTIGESVDPSERFPMQLATRLRERGLNLSEPEIIAKTGWTTDELSSAIDAANPRGPYDLVTLLIGVNNQYRGRDEEEYRREFVSLLQRAVGFAGGRPDRVIVLSIPDWGVTPFAENRDRLRIAREIDQFNMINRGETIRAGARYVDITPISRRPDPSLIAEDRLHPSGKMYAEWARAAVDVAQSALR